MIGSGSITSSVASQVVEPVAVQLTGFQPESGAGGASDPYWDNVSLLLSFDGTSGDTSTTDASSANTPVTFYNTAALSDAQVKFGTTSVLFDGASYLRVDDSLSTLTSTTDPFTIEFWMYAILSGGTGSTSDFFIGINRASDAAGMILIGPRQIALNTQAVVSHGGFAKEQWQHFAYCYDGSNHKVFKDGVLLYEKTASEFVTPISECVFGIGAEFDSADGGTPWKLLQRVY